MPICQLWEVSVTKRGRRAQASPPTLVLRGVLFMGGLGIRN